MGNFTREVDDAVPLTSLGTSGAGGVVHDVKVPEVGGSGHGGTRVPLFGDTLLGVKKNSIEQDIKGYQRRQWVSGRITRVNRMASQSMVAVEPVT